MQALKGQLDQGEMGREVGECPGASWLGQPGKVDSEEDKLSCVKLQKTQIKQPAGSVVGTSRGLLVRVIWGSSELEVRLKWAGE